MTEKPSTLLCWCHR